MIARLDPGQGQLLRALGNYLSKGGKYSMTPHPDSYGLVLESVRSSPWASLTFTGDRHHLVVRLPAGGGEREIDGAAIRIPHRLVAVERAAWATTPSGAQLTLDLLVLWAM